ncbi:unnamed protein product [Acidithrix sp. C25]|nr:unnamed protein product [Acidithrix sp. C25]
MIFTIEIQKHSRADFEKPWRANNDHIDLSLNIQGSPFSETTTPIH